MITPTQTSADVEKLNKAMSVVLTLQARLCCPKSAEALQESHPDIMTIRFWLTQKAALLVQFRWRAGHINSEKFDWYPTLLQGPTLVDIVCLLQDSTHVIDPGRLSKSAITVVEDTATSSA